MDLTRQALQSNGKLFSNFGIIILMNYTFLNNNGIVFSKRGGEAFMLISTRSFIFCE